MVRCPICGIGSLRRGKIKESMFGVDLGEFPAELCSCCGESFTDPETTRKIEEAAKRKGVWGLGVNSRIIRSGNSLAVRIPKKIADYMNLREGDDAFIHPENRKLVIERR